MPEFLSPPQEKKGRQIINNVNSRQRFLLGRLLKKKKEIINLYFGIISCFGLSSSFDGRLYILLDKC